MSQLLNLADNPLFVKHVRSQLRKGALTAPFAIVGFLCLILIWASVEFKPANRPGEAPIVFFWMGSIIIGLMGGSKITTAVAYIRESGILDFHRVTPVSPERQVLGFLLGAPIREWLLFAFVLPFALVSSILSGWGLLSFVQMLLVQITTALFAHTLAVVVGLSGKAKGASGRLVSTLIVLNMVANGTFWAGIYGPSYLTSLAVYQETLFEMKVGVGAIGRIANLPPHRFFGMEVPPVVLTVAFQAILGSFFFIAATRRFRSARQPILSKRQALLLMASITVMTLGTGWNWEGIFLVLTLAYLVTLVGISLCTPATPPLGEYLKGLQRAYKKGSLHAPAWSDLASNKWTVFSFGLVLVAATVLVLTAAPLGGNPNQRFTPWPPLVVGLLTLLGFGWGLQYFHLKYAKRASTYFNLLIFFVWIAPLLLGALFSASRVPEGTYLFALSPIAGIASSALVNLPNVNTETVQALAIGLPGLMTLYFGLRLLGMEAKRRDEVEAEHRPAVLVEE